MVEKQTS